MQRITFRLNLLNNIDNEAYQALTQYPDNYKAEVIRRWVILAGLSENIQESNDLIAMYPYEPVSAEETLEIRYYREDLPANDLLRKVFDKASALTKLKRRCYLRALFILGHSIELGEGVSQRAIKKVIQPSNRPVQNIVVQQVKNITTPVNLKPKLKASDLAGLMSSAKD